MNAKFVRVPISITLEGSILVELEEGESLETLSAIDLEIKTLTEFNRNRNEFYNLAETDIRVDAKHAYYYDDEVKSKLYNEKLIGCIRRKLN